MASVRIRLWGVWLFFWLALPVWAGPKEDALQKKKLGDSLAAEGDYEGALKAYEEGAQLSPSPELELARASMFVKLRRYEEAKGVYQAFLATQKSTKYKSTVTKAISELEIILRTSIECSSDPTGATVYLNSRVDAPLGVTPFTQNIPPGTHRLLFEKEGFRLESKLITVTEGASIRECQVSLTTAPLFIDVKSEPSGAEVFLNGVLQGKAPLTVEAPDKAEIEVKLDTYQSQKKTFEGKPGQKLSWEVMLAEVQSGVVLALSPKNAKVSIEGRPEPIPEGLLLLPPGKYRLSAQAEGHQPFSQEFTVTKGRQEPLNIQLKPSTGKLLLSSNVASPTVLVDQQPLATEKLPAELIIGAHTLRVEAQGKVPYEGAIQIQEDDTLVADVTLRESFRPKAFRLLALSGGLLVASGASLLISRSAQEDFQTAQFPDPTDKLVRDLFLNASGTALGATFVVGYLGMKKLRKEEPSTATFSTKPKEAP